MPVTSLLDVRTELATALSGVAASVYPVAPEAVIPPACVIIPDSPWLESTFSIVQSPKSKSILS